MKRITPFIIFVFLASLCTFVSSCKKHELFGNGQLSFSADTVLFDTVFTTVGSTTKRFKIYNTSNSSINISSVILAGGKDSPYRVNLDGVPGVQFKDVSIPANDSLFMFVEVTLDPNNGTLPLIVEDSILFETNGHTQKVLLDAWGRDAYFYHGDFVSGVWKNDKPHVIYDFAYVDTNDILTIQPGTEIYLHKGAMLIVDGGTLHINGTPTNKVTFQGDRLEAFYKDKPGQYYGIYFNYARTSTVDNVVMKNGTAGIHVTGNNSANGNDYTVKISNTEIYNMARYGIFNYEGGKVKGINLNLHDNGFYAFFQLEGGKFKFNHCQFISYGSDGEKPAIAIKNYFTHSDDHLTYVGSVDGTLYNSIVWGGGKNQIIFDTINHGGTSISSQFISNLIRQEDTIQGSGIMENLWNENPKFSQAGEENYKISETSPCKDAGDPFLDLNISKDIEGNTRSDGKPDIGAYELH